MKKEITKQVRNAVSAVLIIALCLVTFVPAVGMFAEENGTGAAANAEDDGPAIGGNPENGDMPGGTQGDMPGGAQGDMPDGAPGDAPDGTPGETHEGNDTAGEPEGAPGEDGEAPGAAQGSDMALNGTGIPTALSFGEIMPLASDFAYFFHRAGQNDPYGSGHSFMQYYVPAGSDIPMLSFCLEMGKNAPPDSEKVAYTPMAAPEWASALASYGPIIMGSHGISLTTDNPHRFWAMQDAVWALTGADIGAAKDAPVVKELIAAASKPVAADMPSFQGVFPAQMNASVYNDKLVRYGPFRIVNMVELGSVRIHTSDENAYTNAWLGDAAGNAISMSAVPADTNLYVYLPRDINETRRIYIELCAPFTRTSQMLAFQSPSDSYQNQLVMPTWGGVWGTIKTTVRLNGFGEGDITKLDAGWQNGYCEIDYNNDGVGDVYRLEGAKFMVQQYFASNALYRDSDIPVTYDAKTRTYHIGFMAETVENQGRFRIIETSAPYGYRDPIMIEFNISSKYGLTTHGPPLGGLSDPQKAASNENNDGDGVFYALNNLLNVRIELEKRDSAQPGSVSGGIVGPQGGATLAGAYYGLFYAKAVTEPSGISRKANELVCIGITDENGKIVFDNSDAGREPWERRLIWENSNTATNYGTEDFPIYLPVFERQDRRIFPAQYYVQELVPSPGYLLDIDPLTAELDANGVPIPGTGAAKKYEVDARDNGSAKNPAGIRLDIKVTEQVKKRGFLMRKLRSDGYETEIYNFNGAGFSVYLIDDLVDIIKKAAEKDPAVKIPHRGPGGWDKQDFIDFFYDPDFVHPVDENTGKPWYNREGDAFTGRYDFDLYPELLRARIDYVESPVFYSGAGPVPGLRYGEYGNSHKPKDGEIVFPEFPYGEYIVFETYVPPGVMWVKPFVVNIAEDAGDIADGDGVCNPRRPEQSWRTHLDSDMFSVRLRKKDAETGRVIVGKDAAFRLKYLGADGIEGGDDDRWVEMDVPEPGGVARYGTEANPFRVGADGVLILPKKLRAGSYKLYEVEAPAGYVLSYHEVVDDGGFYQAHENQIQKQGYGDNASGSANQANDHIIIYTPVVGAPEPQHDVGIVFDSREAHRVHDFDYDEDGYGDFVIELVQYNELQKGRLHIHKAREAAGAEGAAPALAVPFAGVRFELYAAEDIVSPDGHGAVLYEAGEFVAAAITDSAGNAFFKDLYLGLYTLREADIDDAHKSEIGGRLESEIGGRLISGYKFVDGIQVDLRPPEGAGLREDSPFWQENALVAASWDMLNTWQLGRVEIYKYGEKLPYGGAGEDEGDAAGDGAGDAAGKAAVDAAGRGARDAAGEIPVAYEEGPLAGVVFEVIAAKDIHDVNTGELIWKKGDVVGSITTDEEGRGSLENLLPGDYILREKLAPEGYVPIEDRPFTIRERGHADAFAWYSWDILNMLQIRSRIIAAEVDKDTVKRTSAAFVSLPGQAGYNNVGRADERFRYDVNFRSTSGVWADEFVVDDPLENAVHGKVYVEELWTPVVWGDHDGLWNLWYATNKTNRKTDYSDVSAMDTNPDNPDNPGRIAVYPNTGLKLLAQGLRTDRRYHFTLDDFNLRKGEYLTHLRFEYGRVEVGFTSKNYASISLNGEHRTISGADLKLPSEAANELMLIDPASFGFTAMPPPANTAGAKAGADDGANSGADGGAKAGANGGYVTGIKGDMVDWTPIKGTRFYADGAANPGYELKPASYLVSATKPMSDVDIVNSVSARIARDVVMRGYDQDAVVTKVVDTFEYEGDTPTAGAAKTLDSYPLLVWLLALLSSSIGLLTLGHVSIQRRMRERQRLLSRHTQPVGDGC